MKQVARTAEVRDMMIEYADQSGISSTKEDPTGALE